MAAPAPPFPSASAAHPRPPEDDVRALIALAALGGPERLSHRERLTLGRALDASPELRAELRALAAVAAALPSPAPAPPPAAIARRRLPDALLRPEVVGALAALVLLLGVFRVADQWTRTTGPGTVAIAVVTVPSVTGTAAVTGHPWGTELHIALEGTEPGAIYDVTVTGRTGRVFDAGSFLGGEGTVRYVGTTAAPRDGLRSVRVTDERGGVVLRADLP